MLKLVRSCGFSCCFIGILLVISVFLVLQNATLRSTVKRKESLLTQLTDLLDDTSSSSPSSVSADATSTFIKKLYGVISSFDNPAPDSKTPEQWSKLLPPHHLIYDVVKASIADGSFDPTDTRQHVALSDAMFAAQRIVALRGSDPIRYMGDWAKFYQLFVPTASCDIVHRFGVSGDGGKYVCNPHKLFSQSSGRPCLAYGFGVNDDLSFEAELSTLFGCEVHAFDPTLTGEKATNVRAWAQRTSVTFHDLGFGPIKPSTNLQAPPVTSPSAIYYSRFTGETWPWKTLLQVAESLSHTELDILKFDIEGGEQAVLDEMIESGALKKLQVKMILFEYHESVYYHQDIGDRILRVPFSQTLAPELEKRRRSTLLGFVEKLVEEGYLMFAMEHNVLWERGMEFAFVHRSFL